MLTQKQWKIQHLAEHMSGVAVTAAAEAMRRAAERQSMVRAHAVVAEELREVTKKMMAYVEQNIFGSLDDKTFDTAMREIIKRSAFLALNAGLLACKVAEHKPMAVFAEEILTFSLELKALYEREQEYSDIPAVADKSRVIEEVFYLFTAVSGRYRWCENAHFVNEILNYNPGFIQDGRLVIKNEWREMDMPFIKLGEAADNSGIVIISDDRDPSKKYAVLAEVTVPHSLANSHVGVSTSPTSSDIPVRECWASSDGGEIIFPDWEKLAK